MNDSEESVTTIKDETTSTEIVDLSYAAMCNYYELCTPGLETKNPHFKSSLNLFGKKEQTNSSMYNKVVLFQSNSNTQTATIKSFDNHKVSSSESKVPVKHVKNDKENVIIECNCKDITDNTTIKQKDVIKCNKCQTMVHDKCHNLDKSEDLITYYNCNDEQLSNWTCASCITEVETDTSETAAAEDSKKSTEESQQITKHKNESGDDLKPSSKTTTKSSKTTDKKEKITEEENKEKEQKKEEHKNAEQKKDEQEKEDKQKEKKNPMSNKRKRKSTKESNKKDDSKRIFLKRDKGSKTDNEKEKSSKTQATKQTKSKKD